MNEGPGGQRKVLGKGLGALFDSSARKRDKFNQALEELKKARTMIEEAKEQGFQITEAQEHFNLAEEPLRLKNYEKCIEHAKAAQEAVTLAKENLFKEEEEEEEIPLMLAIDTSRADKAISDTRGIVIELEERGIETQHILMLLAQVQDAFENGEYDRMDELADEARSYAEFVRKIEYSR